MFKTLARLLPNGRAWALAWGSQIRAFFQALSTLGDGVRVYMDQVWLRINPQTTDDLESWEEQFGLEDDPDLTEQDRRDRLDGRWAAFGGQSVEYIKATLDAAGFTSLYVHEWWVPDTATPDPRDPLAIVFGTSIQCGDPEAQCGDPEAQCGGGTAASGYWLVNNEYDPVKYPFITTAEIGPRSQCGDPEAQCGDPAVECAGVGDPVDVRAYFLYIGGVSFGDVVAIDATRRRELEALLLKICPAHLWLILTVEYT